MSNGSKKIKIYFPINMSEKWMGGVNYYKNLFQALSMVKQTNLEIYIPDNNPEILYTYANKLTNKKDIKYRLAKFYKFITLKKFDKNIYFDNKYNFDIISHANPSDYNVKTISWIPDFQHIYYKELFSKEELLSRDKIFEVCAKKSSFIILSSKDAQKDFVNLFPDFAHKSRVLNFVSYINPEIYEFPKEKELVIKAKYNLPEKYFYLPNQFWEHKNHITVFKAINYLKEQGINIQLLCSGYMHDYRNKDYLENVLIKYIDENQLKNNIHFLGIISLEEVYYLMRNSISVINPSLFEGWSSSVEEVKSLGKNIILSDLNVHREQNPAQATYFYRDDFIELSGILKDNWLNNNSGPNYQLEAQARNQMNNRMIEFGNKYIAIVKEILRESK